MRPSNRWRLDLLWAAIVLAAILALAAGSGALGSGRGRTASLYQRALQVAGEYRCPVCQGETAAASDAPQAVEMKSLIQGWLREGRSPAQIRSYLVADYGVSILEKPPASGLGALLWVLPGVAVALGVAGLGFGFSRWRRLASTGPRPWLVRHRRPIEARRRLRPVPAPYLTPAPALSPASARCLTPAPARCLSPAPARCLSPAPARCSRGPCSTSVPSSGGRALRSGLLRSPRSAPRAAGGTSERPWWAE